MIYIAKTIYPVYGGISRHRHTTGDTDHSANMETIGKEYTALVGKFYAEAPKLPFFSSVSNEVIVDSNILNAPYWVKNLTSPVLFTGAVRKLIETIPTSKISLEIRPHQPSQ